MAHMVFGILAIATSMLLLETLLQVMFKERGNFERYRTPVLFALADGRLFKDGVFALREAREKAGMSAEELAEKSGVSRAEIRAFENGVKLPGLFEAKKLAQALGVPMDELVKLLGERKKP